MELDDRRRYRRLLAESGCACILTSGGTSAPCEIIDQSIGGYRVGGINLTHLKKNQSVTIVRKDDIIPAACVNVERMPNGRFTLGLQRDDTVSHSWSTPGAGKDVETAAHSYLINPYVRLNHPGFVLCRLVKLESDQTVHIAVGEEVHQVATAKIQPMTRQERGKELEELNKHRKLDWLASAYMAAHGVEIAADPSTILHYEFGAE